MKQKYTSILSFYPIFVAVKSRTTHYHIINYKIMITSRRISQVNVFAGSPWEVASVKNLLKAAYIEVSMKENGRNGFLLSVPCEYYTAAMRVIGNRKIS